MTTAVSIIVVAMEAELAESLATADGDVASVVTGVGKVNAAAATAYAIARLAPRAVVNVGYCASLDRRFPRGSIAVPTRVVQHDYGHYEAARHTVVRAGRPTLEGRFAPQHERYFAIDEALRRALVAALAASPEVAPSLDANAEPTLATGDLFVVDTAKSASIRDATEADLLDMEAAAIAQVCFAAGVPFASVKVVSDDASAEGIAHYASALQALRGGIADVTAAVARALRALPDDAHPGTVGV